MNKTNKNIIERAINEISLNAVDNLLRGIPINKQLNLIKDLEGLK
jgi:hypothetical protein